MLIAFDELGIAASELSSVRVPGSLSDMRARLKDLQVRVKKGFKEAALRLHPDVNPDNPEAEDLFKLVSEVVRQIAALRIKERPRSTVITYNTTSQTFPTRYGKIRINLKVKDD
jgi:hypothetical protein